MPDGADIQLTLHVSRKGDGGIEAYLSHLPQKDPIRRKWALSTDRLCLATIDVFEHWLQRDGIQRREDLEVLGTYLYNLIFGGDDKNTLLEAMKVAAAARRRLRLRLNFEDEAADLIDLPWEFLYNEEICRGKFISTRVDVVLSRYTPVTDKLEPLDRSPRPLKLLLVVSSPAGEGTVSADDPVSFLCDELPVLLERAAGNEGVDLAAPLEVELLEQPTFESLEAKLKAFPPHVFHFIGHGEYSRELRKGVMALVDKTTGKADWRDDLEVVGLFEQAEVYPRLVFLQMCKGGKAESSMATLAPYVGFAPRLLSAQIPAVVAMRYPISNLHANYFCKAFYEALVLGCDVDEAVQKGRTRVGVYCGHKSGGFGTPILYLHRSDGLIDLPPKREQGGGAGTATGTRPGGSGKEQEGTTAGTPTGDRFDTRGATGAPTGDIQLSSRLFSLVQPDSRKLPDADYIVFSRAWEQLEKELREVSAHEAADRICEAWRALESDSVRSLFRSMIVHLATAAGAAKMGAATPGQVPPPALQARFVSIQQSLAGVDVPNLAGVLRKLLDDEESAEARQILTAMLGALPKVRADSKADDGRGGR